jgi:uncharacterized membrane protein YgcG
MLRWWLHQKVAEKGDKMAFIKNINSSKTGGNTAKNNGSGQYAINYDDERFQKVESDKKQALTQLEQTYGGMIGESDKYYQAQIDASKQWVEEQKQQQQANTEFAIDKIEQQKGQAHKDYLREQSGAYTDWQKQSNRYGVQAEQQATQGLIGSGFGESAQVSMYNTYQNRVMTARESYNNAVLNYNNAIKDAQLQNNSALAEIAYKGLQQQLELSLQGFQYKNQLLLEQMNKRQELDNQYYSRYQDVLQQMNTENALAENIRQFNKQYQLQMKEYEEGIRQFNEEIARLKAKDEKEYQLEIQQLELDKKRLEQEQMQWEKEYQLQLQKVSSSGGGGGGGSSRSYSSGGGSKGGSGSGTINKTPTTTTPKPLPTKLNTASDILKDMLSYKARGIKTTTGTIMK